MQGIQLVICRTLYLLQLRHSTFGPVPPSVEMERRADEPVRIPGYASCGKDGRMRASQVIFGLTDCAWQL